jgi:multisubunit Na+/H+ antiporter MnhB subunit
MRSFFKIMAWINGAVGIVLMLLGIIAVLAGDRFLGHFWSNYFYPAYNFILLGMFFFLAILINKDNKS